MFSDPNYHSYMHKAFLFSNCSYATLYLEETPFEFGEDLVE
jgi:hypothetical protein